MTRNIRKYGLLVSVALLTLSYGCSDWLEGVEKIGKYQRKDLMNADGIMTIRAGVLHYIPMEDFNYRPNDSSSGDAGVFYSNDLGGVGVGGFTTTAHFTDEATLSQGSGLGPGGSNDVFNLMYQQNRRVSSYLLKDLPEVLENGSISQADYDLYVAEARFVRAYMYYQLVRRYGGVPIITEFQDDIYFAEGPEALFIPRSTEVQTWDFIMTELDAAAAVLPADEDNRARVTKWAALALKTRAALYAASIAKYGDRVAFAGPAAQQGLVGIPASEANRFYGLAIGAAEQIINSNKFSLYEPTPGSPEDAAVNYQALFQTPSVAASEVIFWRTYQDGESSKVSATGHDYDARYWPNQNPGSWHKWGRYSIMLDMVDLYEDYADNGQGLSAPISTRTDGNESVYFTANTVLEGSPEESFVKSVPFKGYDHPFDPFKNKDARLHASVVVPGSTWAGTTTIMMQGGLITPAGKPYVYVAAPANEATVNGLTYSSWGPIQDIATGAMVDLGKGGFSGFSTADNPIGTHEDNINFATTGFSLRKFLNEGGNKDLAMPRRSTNQWIDFRLPEIYLSYAEAVLESGQGSVDNAKTYLNAIRRRAAHMDQIPATIENVLKERRVELAFEGHRLYDQLRRREYHTANTNSTKRKALIPMMDLRGAEPKYVFLRADFYYDVRAGSRQFNINNYYYGIPSYTTNRLVGNPGQE